MPPGPLYEYLAQDHARLHALLRASVTPAGAIDPAPYAGFRAGLVRHISIEERMLLPTARQLRGGEPLPIAEQLKRDHAALAALLVPPPTPQLVATIDALLARHNELEEGPGGVYEVCERLARDELEALTERLRAAPDVPLAPHVDSPLVRAHIAQLLEAAYASRSSDT